jgi:hypothetical protein
MALDTETKRRRALRSFYGLGLRGPSYLVADGTIDQTDRAQIVGFYYAGASINYITVSVGDRYIAGYTEGDWTENNVYEWSGSEWLETTATEGMVLYNKDDGLHYLFNGSEWVSTTI